MKLEVKYFDIGGVSEITFDKNGNLDYYSKGEVINYACEISRNKEVNMFESTVEKI